MKIAVIGAGTIGKLHLKTLDIQGRRAAAVCDIQRERAEALSKEYAPGAKIYTDWEEMLRTEKPDAVHICTPHYLHARQVITALGMGINVLCEKPLCAHPHELAAVLEAEKASSAKLGVCHQNRYNESTRFALEILKNSKPISAHGSVCWFRDEKYYRDGEWRGKLNEAGGGVLINQALHTLDLIRYLCSDPKWVRAKADILSPKEGVEVEDTVNAVFGGGDCGFTFFATLNNPCNMPIEITVKLENGDILAVLPDKVTLNGEKIFIKANEDTAGGKAYYGGSHGLLFDDYYSCIAEGRQFPINGEEAAKVMKLIFGVYASEGNTVNL